MNIYLVKRDGPTGYDQYASFVVVAKTKQAARLTHPSKFKPSWDGHADSGWVNCNKVLVTFLGAAHGSLEAGVVCSDFNAG